MANGQLTVSVSVEKLLDTLQINRDGHAAEYAKAKAGYIKVTTGQLNDYIERLANGEMLGRAYIPQPPEDHTGDYDDAIAMMQWSQDATIDLTQDQFKQYVQDDWGWKSSWVTSNSTYTAAAVALP